MVQPAGYKGVPSFKIRPKALSMHGRQLCMDPYTGQTVFSVAKISRIKTMSLRHNLAVCIGDSDEEVRLKTVRATHDTGRAVWVCSYSRVAAAMRKADLHSLMLIIYSNFGSIRASSCCTLYLLSKLTAHTCMYTLGQASSWQQHGSMMMSSCMSAVSMARNHARAACVCRLLCVMLRL
jgi:hypothetical protein